MVFGKVRERARARERVERRFIGNVEATLSDANGVIKGECECKFEREKERRKKKKKERRKKEMVEDDATFCHQRAGMM